MTRDNDLVLVAMVDFDGGTCRKPTQEELDAYEASKHSQEFAIDFAKVAEAKRNADKVREMMV